MLAEFSIGVQGGSRPGLATILRRHEASIGADGANGLHGEDRGSEFIGKGADIAAHAVMMRVPMAIEAAEPGGSLGFVDRRVSREEGIAACDGEGVLSQARGEVGGEEICVSRAAAVVNEAGNRINFQGAHASQGVIEGLPASGPGESLPVQSITESAQSKAREAIEIRESAEVSGAFDLVEEGVPDAVDGALHATPEFEWQNGGGGMGEARHDGFGCPERYRVNDAGGLAGVRGVLQADVRA
jgi:hypothetical protein